MNCTKKTVRSYTDTLKPFQTFCDLQGVKNLADIDNFFVDNYFADMADKGHSDGGMHSMHDFRRYCALTMKSVEKGLSQMKISETCSSPLFTEKNNKKFHKNSDNMHPLI